MKRRSLFLADDVTFDAVFLLRNENFSEYYVVS